MHRSAVVTSWLRSSTAGSGSRLSPRYVGLAYRPSHLSRAASRNRSSSRTLVTEPRTSAGPLARRPTLRADLPPRSVSLLGGIPPPPRRTESRRHCGRTARFVIAAAGRKCNSSWRATGRATRPRRLVCIPRAQVAAPAVLDPVCIAHLLLNQTHALWSRPLVRQHRFFGADIGDLADVVSMRVS